MNFGMKIATLRKGKGLTQAELGESLNVSAQAVSKWENGASQPDIDSLKKLSELFEISLDDLLNENTLVMELPQKQLSQQSSAVESKNTITCYRCNTSVADGEYEIVHDSDPNATIPNKIYCKDCYAQIMKEKEEADKLFAKQQELKEKQQKEEELKKRQHKSKKSFFKGMWIGGVVSIIAAIIIIFIHVNNPTPISLALCILLPIGFFTLSSQFYWGNFIADFFLFFCRSFKAPFGLIFSFSLDGIIWLLTVKLFLWIIFGSLSVLFFLCGLFLSLALSIFIFPFALPIAIKQYKNGELDNIFD